MFTRINPEVIPDGGISIDKLDDSTKGIISSLLQRIADLEDALSQLTNFEPQYNCDDCDSGCDCADDCVEDCDDDGCDYY